MVDKGKRTVRLGASMIRTLGLLGIATLVVGIALAQDETSAPPLS
jgi:hypothetical protein